MKFFFPSLIKKAFPPNKRNSTNHQPPADLALLPPPTVWSRVLIWTLGTGSLGILLWSTVTKVEETVILAGEITTEKPGVQVTAVDPGTTTEVHVQIHQRVIAGDVLITYNDNETEQRLQSKLREKAEVETQLNENQTIFSLRRKQTKQRLALDLDLLQRLENLLAVGAIQETQILEKQAEITKSEITLGKPRERADPFQSAIQ